MSVMNDDGYPLDLASVFIFFMMPNFILIFLTTLIAYLLRISKNHPQLKIELGKLANCFAKGALDRIIRNILRNLETEKHQMEPQSPGPRSATPNAKRYLYSSSDSFHTFCRPKFEFERKHDANYLFLIPFQIDLLLTVFVYKILTREVYVETCQSFLTTYHNRPTQVVCWLKNINRNISNLSINISLYQYCSNQSITYINYEHNDVVCAQYVFKTINIIDTITNMFAWHQAIVFMVTRSIVFSHWYQRIVRKTLCWARLTIWQRRIILTTLLAPISTIYFIFFVILLPLRFLLEERRRIDLTRHLIYACTKFVLATLVHTNLYTLSEWSNIFKEKEKILAQSEEPALPDAFSTRSPKLHEDLECCVPLKSIPNDDGLTITPENTASRVFEV